MSGRGDLIVTAIEDIRREHHACSLGMLSNRLKLSKSYLHELLGELQQQGYVNWSPGIAGSIHLTTPPTPVESVDDQTETEDETMACLACDFVAKSAAGLIAHARAKH